MTGRENADILKGSGPDFSAAHDMLRDRIDELEKAIGIDANVTSLSTPMHCVSDGTHYLLVSVLYGEPK